MFKRFTLPTILFVFTFILLTGIVSSKGFTAENVTVGAVGRVVYEEFSADVERKAIYLATLFLLLSDQEKYQRHYLRRKEQPLLLGRQ